MAAFMGIVECKNYPKAVWNSMSKKQQMQVRKLHEPQGINPAAKQIRAVDRFVALEAKLQVSSQQ